MQKNDIAGLRYVSLLQSSLIIPRPVASTNVPGIVNKSSLFKFKNIVFAALAILMVIPALVSAQTTPLINSKLNGKVVDARTKESLPGATVAIKGTTHSVATDGSGKFNFVTGQKFPYTLIVSFVGYKTRELVVDTENIEIGLEESASTLNDVVVVGYATQQRRDVVGAVTKLDPAATKTIPRVALMHNCRVKLPACRSTPTLVYRAQTCTSAYAAQPLSTPTTARCM
jgi:hypothetical protein